jgi:hypothetical protein
LRENRPRIPQTSKLFPSQPRVPATQIAQSAQSAPKPGAPASPATITLRTIRVLTKKTEVDHGDSLAEENSLQEIISKYQVLLGTKNAYLTSFLAVLLKEGKVCVESDKISERIQLLDAQSRIDAPTAASLLAKYFEEQRAESQMDSRSTQRIVLHPPSKTSAPKN